MGANLANYEAISIADAALRIVDAARTRLQHTNKLIIALGENHNTDSHRALAVEVLEGLVAHKIPTSFALEEQANIIPAFLRDMIDIDISHVSPAIWAMMNELDSNGHIRAKTILSMDEDPSRSPLETALKHKLPVIYADAARKKTEAFIALDRTDFKTAAFVEAILGDSMKDIDIPAASIAGLHIRNHFMLRTCSRSPQFLGNLPHVILLQTGRGHIQGSETEHTYDAVLARRENRPSPAIPYDESLVALAAQEDIAMLPVCLTSPAGVMNGVESDYREGTFYFSLPGNALTPPATDSEAAAAKRLAYAQDSVQTITQFMNLSKALKAAPAP